MKVVHFYPVWLSQTATWLYYQVIHLPAPVETHVVCERTENLDQFPVPHLHALSRAPRWQSLIDRGMRRLRLRKHLGLLARVVQREQIELVHFHFGPIACRNLPALRGTGARSVVTFYGLDVNQLPQNDPALRAQYQLLFQSVDSVLCEGPFMAGCIRELGCSAEKVRVHHLGVPLEALPFSPRAWKPGEPLKMLIASSFVEKKGITFALQAIARLSRELPVRLTLIGDAPAQGDRGSAEKARILELLEAGGLNSVTTLAGYVPHRRMLELSRDHHLFVSTSVTASNGDTEGGAPVSIIEMAASGMGIVSSRHCDIPNVVEDGVGGRLSDERDVEGIYRDLRWFVEHPDRWLAMQQAARAHVEKHFDCVKQGVRLAEVYQQVANG